MKEKLRDHKRKKPSFAILASIGLLLLIASTPALAFDPMTLMNNLMSLLSLAYDLLGYLFGVLGLAATGFAIWMGREVLKGGQAAQRLENPWAYVIGGGILGVLLTSVGAVMTGVWENVVGGETSSDGGGASGANDDFPVL